MRHPRRNQPRCVPFRRAHARTGDDSPRRETCIPILRADFDLRRGGSAVAEFREYLQMKLGVRKGDRIAVMMPNLLAFPIAFLGIIRAGGVQRNVNPLYTPRELEYQLKDAGVKVMVVFAGSSATVAEVLTSTPLETVITVGPGDGSAANLPSPPADPRLRSALAFAD